VTLIAEFTVTSWIDSDNCYKLSCYLYLPVGQVRVLQLSYTTVCVLESGVVVELPQHSAVKIKLS
jgi:hypothetical protein